MHAIALVLAGLLASALVGGIVLRDALIQDHDRQLEREVVRADAHARLARRHLQAFQLRQAQQALQGRQVERAQDILATIQSDRDRSDADEDPGDPGFAWHYLIGMARRDVVVLSDRKAERINALALSADGRTLATGDEDGTIRLRDPETGRVLTSLQGHRAALWHLAFDPDGHHLASQARAIAPFPGDAGELYLWDLAGARLLARLAGFSGRIVEDLRFGLGGQRLWEISWSERDRLELGLWDVASDPARPRLLWRRPTGASVLPVNPDGRIVALEEPGRRFLVHDIAKPMDLGRTAPIDHDARFAAPSPDGRLLALGGACPTVSLWDLKTGREVSRFDLPRVDLRAIRFAPDGRFLTFEFGDGEIVVRDCRTGDTRTVAPSAVPPGLSISLASSSDGRFLAANVSRVPGAPQPTRTWQLDPWRLIATYPGVPESTGTLQFTPDARSLIINHGRAAVRWDFARPPEPGQPVGHADEAWSLAFSPDGKTLASGSDDDDRETIKIWDVATGSPIRGWHAGRGTVASLAIDPRGRIVASAHLGQPGELRLWDPATGRRLETLAGHTDSVRTVAFSPDGTLLASAGSDRAVRLWDVASRRCLRILDQHVKTVRQVAFSPDGSLLASASNDYTVRLWETATGRLGHTLREVEDVAAVAFAPDGNTLAAADEKGMVSTWDVASGIRIQSMAFEHDFPLSIAYSPDGRSLAVAGKTRTIRLWDPVTGQEMLTLDGHKAQVNRVAFSPDGTALASCGHDGAVRLWRSVP